MYIYLWHQSVVTYRPSEREETERVIRSALKEIMMSVDLDEVTSKFIRGRLEETLDMDLGEYKPFIDQEMLTVLGQMDAATQIFPHVYLGSEWNASNLDELNRNGYKHTTDKNNIHIYYSRISNHVYIHINNTKRHIAYTFFYIVFEGRIFRYSNHNFII